MKAFKKKSSKLKKAADKFIEQHQLEKIFEKHGDYEYFGSYAVNLMNREDIDVALIVDEIEIETITNLIKDLNKIGFNRHWIFDNTDGGYKPDPKHIIYEGIYGFFNEKIKPEDRWELGIVVTTPEIFPEIVQVTEQVKLLPEEKKETILKLKFELAQKYGDHRYTGTQVSRSVIEDDCDSIESFLEYIEE